MYINDGEGIVGMVRYIYKNTGEFSHYQRLYYLYDSLGSVSVVTGENVLPLQNYTYSPYGSCMSVEYDPVNNLRFVGRYGGYKDDDIGLTYFILRWYNTDNGNFISRDKLNMGAINYRISSIYILYFVKKINIILNSLVDIRELNYRDLLGNERKMFVNKRINNYFSINYRMNNLYLYSNNNVLNYFDPLGLWWSGEMKQVPCNPPEPGKMCWEYVQCPWKNPTTWKCLSLKEKIHEIMEYIFKDCIAPFLNYDFNCQNEGPPKNTTTHFQDFI